MTDAVSPEVRHRVDRNHGLDEGRIRNRERMLRRAGVGRPDRANSAVGPRLRAYPRRGIEPVVRIVANGPPVALGLVPRTHVLNDHDVAARHEVVGGRCRAVLVVRRALQESRELAIDHRAVPRRTIHIGRKLHAVAHGDHHVLRGDDVVRRRTLRAERLTASAEQRQKPEEDRGKAEKDARKTGSVRHRVAAGARIHDRARERKS